MTSCECRSHDGMPTTQVCQVTTGVLAYMRGAAIVRLCPRCVQAGDMPVRCECPYLLGGEQCPMTEALYRYARDGADVVAVQGLRAAGRRARGCGDAVMQCSHNDRGECWLCSDLDPRWREWRIGAGLPENPPLLEQRLRRKAEWVAMRDRVDEFVERSSRHAFAGWHAGVSGEGLR